MVSIGQDEPERRLEEIRGIHRVEEARRFSTSENPVTE
jgi:hypothetical protein